MLWRVLTDVPTEDMLDLLLLEATLDNETAGTVDRAGGTHFREHVLDDVLGLAMHTLANVGDVREDGLLVSFTKDLRRRDRVPLPCGREQCGVGCVQLAVEPVKKLNWDESTMQAKQTGRREERTSSYV